jgi:hypothetical protein
MLNKGMRLSEIQTPKFYLFTRKTHSPGTILGPSIDSAPLGTGIEGWLEKLRPHGRLSRSGSIFLQTVQEMPTDDLFAYDVEPLEPPELCHSGWLRLLRQSGADQPLIEQLAKNYWDGVECPTTGGWEYRTSGARVVRRVRRSDLQSQP